MPDDILPPSQDDSSKNGDTEPNDPFSQFVNDELDITSLDQDINENPSGSVNPFSRLPSRPAFPPLGSNNSPDDEDDDDDDERRSSSSPFSGLPRQSFGAGLPSSSSGSAFGAGRRRYTFPTLDDPRWIDGVYQVEESLKIYKEPHMFAGYTRNDRAHLRWDKTVRYINDVMPGWAAVYFGGRRTMTGYVRSSEVMLVPGTGFRANLRSWVRSKTNLLDALAVLCVILLLLLLAYELDRQARSGDDTLTTLQAAVQAQHERIESLESRVDALEAQLQLQSE